MKELEYEKEIVESEDSLGNQNDQRGGEEEEEKSIDGEDLISPDESEDEND